MTTGSEDNLTCIGQYILVPITKTHIYLSDIDECSENEDICGLGTCSNNDDGTFYECTCQDGAKLNGSNSDNSLTCVGMSQFSFNTPIIAHAISFVKCRYQRV